MLVVLKAIQLPHLLFFSKKKNSPSYINFSLHNTYTQETKNQKKKRYEEKKYYKTAPMYILYKKMCVKISFFYQQLVLPFVISITDRSNWINKS
jgi:hypothetical protein